MTSTEHVHQDYASAYSSRHTVYALPCPVTGECEAHYSSCLGQGRCQPDPYDLDVNGEANYRILCDSCENEIADDV